MDKLLIFCYLFCQNLLFNILNLDTEILIDASIFLGGISSVQYGQAKLTTPIFLEYSIKH